MAYSKRFPGDRRKISGRNMGDSEDDSDDGWGWPSTYISNKDSLSKLKLTEPDKVDSFRLEPRGRKCGPIPRRPHFLSERSSGGYRSSTDTDVKTASKNRYSPFSGQLLTSASENRRGSQRYASSSSMSMRLSPSFVPVMTEQCSRERESLRERKSLFEALKESNVTEQKPTEVKKPESQMNDDESESDESESDESESDESESDESKSDESKSDESDDDSSDDMSSKQQHGESSKTFYHGRKQTQGKQTSKEAYNQKIYKSSPTLPSPNDSKHSNKKPTKGGNLNVENDDKQENFQSLSAQKRNAAARTKVSNKNNKEKEPDISHILSELSFKHTKNFRRGTQQHHFNASSGTYMQHHKEPPKHHEVEKPFNPNLAQIQNRLPRNQGNATRAESQKNDKYVEPTQFSHYSDILHQHLMKDDTSGMQNNCRFNFPNYDRQDKCNIPGEHSKPNVSLPKQSSVPFIKHKKEKANSVNQISKQKRPRGEKKKKTNCGNKKLNDLENENAVHLLSLLSSNTEPESSFDLLHFDDDDDDDDPYSLSQQSTDFELDFSDDDLIDDALLQPSLNTDINFSFDNSLSQLSLDSTMTSVLSENESESDSTEESEESNLTSEFSVESSVLSKDTTVNISKPNTALKESFVSVFWDIENCALPQSKSAVHFVSYIRDKFYEGRTEVTFTVVCDVSNLSPLLVRDLDEAAITLIHVSSLNKNAADKKIVSLLQRFQLQYRNNNSALVLISSDSDFSQVLLDMRYQHHIFVNVICKNNTRDSLTKAANKCVLFEDILSDLSDRSAEENIQHVINVTNLPQMKASQIKNSLSEKLKIFNCKVRCADPSVAKIIFKDHSVCLKALNSLGRFYLGGNALVFTYEKEKVGNEVLSSKGKKEKVNLLHPKEKSVPKNETALNSSMKESSSGKGATLCVVVSEHLKDAEYWEKEFETMWKMGDFSIHWEDGTFGGYFLINFKSLKKAKKVKKMLQENQLNDLNAPKFLKFIRHEDDLDNLKMNITDDIEETNKKKIEEHLKIIEMKKLTLFKKHENKMDELKQTVSKEGGKMHTVNEKLKEFNEQKITFSTYTNKIITSLKRFSYNSENLEQQLKDILCDFTREGNSFASALPIYAKKDTILKKISEYQVTVISAETGSGKSTQLPQYISNEKNKFKKGRVICTQPKKISAIAHAKYVSLQIASRLGDTVGYQVGMAKRFSSNTNILYVTDFTMLKILVSGDLENVSCIIIDEADERSVYTDILLAMIKQHLPMHPHLRIVITSATDNVSDFLKFFNLTHNNVLHIPRRNFPFDVHWLDCGTTPDEHYFFKAIDKTFEILNEDPGDILTFLTEPIETEKACTIFSKKLKGNKVEQNVTVFYLHDRMDPEELRKVLEKTPKGKRKVVFATSSAEASVTIPDIKYVVDCGLVREYKFDAVRKLNVLSLDFISKSSSEHRSRNAGWSHVGECYRLYSKDVYNSMALDAIPEILRVNLGQAVLKFFEMGIKNPRSFNFIQRPPNELLTLVMDQLLFLKAIDKNFILTDLGKNMAALPLEPRLCHLIFQGFENGIGYDTLVTAALITVSQTIFFRNSENKDKIEEKRKRFCEHGSDFISYLEVYKEWAEVPKSVKSQWCLTNCINGHSMHNVHDLINEMVSILQQELHFKVKFQFNSEPSTYDTLARLIFYSFSQNLSVFSGHYKYGYKSLSIPDQLFIHFQSSSLFAFGQPEPQFVVFDTILDGARTFMVNVSPVTKSMILDAVQLHDLKIDLESLENLSGKEMCISPVSKEVILKYFLGKKGAKQRELLRKMKEITQSDCIELDFDMSKQSIRIFGFIDDFEGIQALVSGIIGEALQCLAEEKREVCLLENSDLTAVLARGGQIQDVVLPGEFRDIEVILKSDGSIESASEKLSLCGTITGITEKHNKYRVTFSTNASAKKALGTYYNETGFMLKNIHKSASQRNYLYKISMSFIRRPCLGIAYVSVHPKVSASSLPSAVEYENSSASVHISKKTGDICISKLPINANKKKLLSIVSNFLPSNRKVKKCIIPRKKPYESTAKELYVIKRNLLKLFAKLTDNEAVKADLKKPESERDSFWLADMYFKNCFDGEYAVSILRNEYAVSVLSNHRNLKKRLGGFVLKPELMTSLCCKPQIFSAVKENIMDSLESLKVHSSSSLCIDAIPANDAVEIKIKNNSVWDVTNATRSLYKILSGDEYKFRSASDKAKLFSNSGKEMLKKLSSEFEDCYIFQNEYKKTLSIFGNKTSCHKIKMRINQFLNVSLNKGLKKLSLKTSSGKTILQELLREYGYDMQKLKECSEISDIDIDRESQLVIIQGDPLSVQKCEAIIQDLKEGVDARTAELKGEICPVCHDEVSDNKYYLQLCRHAYCQECILHLFHSSTNIPLTCETCRTPVVVADIFWAIKGRKTLKEALFKKFLLSFVESQSHISFCPSPDCSMIFRVTEDEINCFLCPSCQNDICTRCGDYHHFGMTCSLNKYLKSNSESSLKIWKEEDPINHKLCPSCSCPIERNGNYKYMGCWQCKCHMCWLCMEVFPNQNEVYSHILSNPKNHPLIN